MDQETGPVATKVWDCVDRAVYWVQFGKINRKGSSDSEVEVIRREMRKLLPVGGVTFFYIVVSLVVGSVIFSCLLAAVLPASILNSGQLSKLQWLAVVCLMVWVALPWFVHTYQFFTREGNLEREGVLKVFQLDFFYLFGLITAVLLLWNFDTKDALIDNVVSSLGPFVFAGPFLLIVFDAYAKVPAGMSREEREQLRKQLSDIYDNRLERIAGWHTVDEWKKRKKMVIIWIIVWIALVITSACVIGKWDIKGLGAFVISIIANMPLFAIVGRLGSTGRVLRIRQRLDEASQSEVCN